MNHDNKSAIAIIIFICAVLLSFFTWIVTFTCITRNRMYSEAYALRSAGAFPQEMSLWKIVDTTDINYLHKKFDSLRMEHP